MSRFAAKEIIALFPAMVFALPVSQDLPALAAAARPRLLGEGPRWLTPPDLHRDPAFAALNLLLTQGARQALDELGYRKGLRPLVTSLWATVAPATLPEPLVQSANAFFGGLLLLEAPGEQPLRFADPRPQAQLLQPAVSEVNALNATEATVPLPAGQALLFPGWLRHGFGAATRAGERVALRFSLLFEDFVAEVGPPNWDHPHGQRMAS